MLPKKFTYIHVINHSWMHRWAASLCMIKVTFVLFHYCKYCIKRMGGGGKDERMKWVDASGRESSVFHWQLCKGRQQMFCTARCIPTCTYQTETITCTSKKSLIINDLMLAVNGLASLCPPMLVWNLWMWSQLNEKSATFKNAERPDIPKLSDCTV